MRITQGLLFGRRSQSVVQCNCHMTWATTRQCPSQREWGSFHGSEDDHKHNVLSRLMFSYCRWRRPTGVLIAVIHIFAKKLKNYDTELPVTRSKENNTKITSLSRSGCRVPKPCQIGEHHYESTLASCQGDYQTVRVRVAPKWAQAAGYKACLRP